MANPIKDTVEDFGEEGPYDSSEFMRNKHKKLLNEMLLKDVEDGDFDLKELPKFPWDHEKNVVRMKKAVK